MKKTLFLFLCAATFVVGSGQAFAETLMNIPPDKRFSRGVAGGDKASRNVDVRAVTVKALPKQVRAFVKERLKPCYGGETEFRKNWKTYFNAYRWVSDKQRKDKNGANYVIDFTKAAKLPVPESCTKKPVCQRTECSVYGYSALEKGKYQRVFDLKASGIFFDVKGKGKRKRMEFGSYVQRSKKVCKAEGGQYIKGWCHRRFQWRSYGLQEIKKKKR